LTIKTEDKLNCIIQNIRSAIEKSKYKPSEIARLLDMHKSTVSMWMNGKRVPTAKNLIELANVLNIDVTSLWDNVDESKPKTTTKKRLLQMIDKLNDEQIGAISVVIKSMMPPPEIEEILSSVKSLDDEQQKAITTLADIIKHM